MTPICKRRCSADICSFNQVRPSGTCAIPVAKGMEQCHTPVTPRVQCNTDLREFLERSKTSSRSIPKLCSLTDEQWCWVSRALKSHFLTAGTQTTAAFRMGKHISFVTDPVDPSATWCRKSSPGYYLRDSPPHSVNSSKLMYLCGTGVTPSLHSKFAPL